MDKRSPFREENYPFKHWFLNANVQKKSIVHAMRLFDKVQFFDLDGKLKKQHMFSLLKMPSLDADNALILEETFYYFSSVKASSDYCFVVRSGRKSQWRAGDISTSPPLQLLVFNWDGLLLNTFEIPAIEVSKMCFDDDLGYLYTFQSSEEVYDLYVTVRKYDLNEYLKVD